MATKTIGQLTQATTINNADEFAIEQSGVTKRVAASVVRSDIVNANISASASIAYSKLNLSNSIVAGDITAAAITPAKLSQPYTLATAKAFNWNGLTTNTVIDFESIPSWAKRITVMFRGVSTTPNNSNDKIIRVGTSAGIVSSGYTSTSLGIQSAATGSISSTEGFRVAAGGFADEMSGHLLLTNVSGNVWLCSGTAKTNTGYMIIAAGDVSLSGTLDRVRITTVNGTDTFDAGTVNIAYEG